MNKLKHFPFTTFPKAIVARHVVGVSNFLLSNELCNSILWRRSFGTSTAFKQWPREIPKGEEFTSQDVNTLCKSGRVKEAMYILRFNDCHGIRTDCNTYAFLLQACIVTNALAEAKQIHAHMIDAGFEPDIVLANNLINMHAKGGSVNAARQVFDKMSERSVVSWTSMLTAYAQYGNGAEAFKLFCEMRWVGSKPNQFTFASVLRAITGLGALQQGKQVHAQLIMNGYEAYIFVGNALVTMYSKCGSMNHALQVFDEIPEPDLVSWNAIIAGYVREGHVEDLLHLFEAITHVGIRPDGFTFSTVLSGCSGSGALVQGKLFHAHIIKSGFELNMSVGNALVTMYSKCGSREDARRVFNVMPKRDEVSWSAMIAGYAQDGHGEDALKLFCQMQMEGTKLNQFTFASVLSACVSFAALEPGKQVHAHTIKSGFELDVFVGSNLVDMYAKCGSIGDGYLIFDKMPVRDVISWSLMIAGYAQHGYGEDAIKLFCQMQLEGIELDHFTFVSVLRACANLADMKCGRQIHAHIMKAGFELDVFVGNALVDMYAKCESIETARNVFDKMPKRDEVSWTAMIVGCVQQRHCEEALKLFCEMQQKDMKPNQFTFASVLRACASLAALDQGNQVHGHIVKSVYFTDAFVGSALVDMYAKCGSIEDACKVFDDIPNRDVVSWNAMISGFAQHGHSQEVLQLIEQMLQEGMEPNSITFVGILSACSHGGLVDEGCCHFNSMIQDYGITPTMEHYACIVDLLGRAGLLDEAEDFINKMPFKPDAVVWQTLLGACRIHCSIELGERVAGCILELEPEDASAYVLLSNIYAASGRWNDVAKMRKMMKDRGVKKEPGRSWIEFKGKVHSFVVGDSSHPKTKEIYAKLEELSGYMKERGYVPDTNFVLQDVEHNQKEHSLCHHSEKLAIAFGLITIPGGTPIRVVKNLRVCGDCHTAIKFISKIVEREIVVVADFDFERLQELDGPCFITDVSNTSNCGIEIQSGQIHLSISSSEGQSAHRQLGQSTPSRVC
eukprot:Gb_10133 [translate_table: standard]